MTVYLDYNGTTPVDQAVRESMLPYLGEHYGNPSSSHWAGKEAREAVEHSRRQVAALLGGSPEEIVFTSGGSESDNLALQGIVFANWRPGQPSPHIVTSMVEHPAVDNCCSFLESLGVRITRLAVDRHGRLTPEQVAAAMTDETLLVSLMLANNETGVVFPLAEIAEVTRARGVLLHTDAVQAVGKMPVDVQSLGVDLLSISGHKFYAPKGIGALWIRSGVSVAPLIHGGGQEQGRRSGTEAVAGIVGLGKAASLLTDRQPEEMQRLAKLRHYCEASLTSELQGVTIHGAVAERLTNTTSFSVPGVDGESLRVHLELQGIAVSAGSACSSGNGKGSRVLGAMGIPYAIAQSSLRISLGRWTTIDEIDTFVEILKNVSTSLQAISPLY
ncbi:MAG: cysteine desulfurase [Deltaproteobacteria bacterium]|nr:cysteine desulfurase [Candidatus Anaeroferrophillus wilburensis]MBN2889900.1 cysteine desulfurase [Deltaproteobacteria bacterium]